MRRIKPSALNPQPSTLNPQLSTLNPQPSTLNSRPGFTLVELLVVIGIIIFLVAVSLVVSMNMLRKARERATAATIQKIHKLVEQRLEGFERALNSQEFKRIVADEQRSLQRNQIYGVSPKAIEAAARKYFVRMNFPQRFRDYPDGEDQDHDGVLDAGEDVNRNGTLDGTNGRPDIVDRIAADPQIVLNLPNHRSETESSELLYYALTRMEVFGIASVDEDAFTSSEVGDTDNDGLKEFIDAWGNPLRFYRWPTRLIKPFGLFGPDGQPGVSGANDDGDSATDTYPSCGVPPVTIKDFGEVGRPGSDDLTQIVAVGRRTASLLIGGLPAAPVTGERDPLAEDPDDPLGLILREMDRLAANCVNVSAVLNEANCHTFDTYHAFLIVSVGADGQLGLYEPYAIEDANRNGVLDAGEDANGDGRLNYGTLAELSYGPDGRPGVAGVDDNGAGGVDDALELGWPDSDEYNALADNITNRNQRAGGN